MKQIAALAGIGVLLTAPNAFAHGARRGSLDLVEAPSGDVTVVLRAPGVRVAPPPECAGEPIRARGGEAAFARWSCPDGLAAKTLVVAGLGDATDLVVARAERGGGLTESVFSPATPSWTLPRRETWASVAARFLRLGIAHVASGADHVLFLLALVWLAIQRGSLGDPQGRIVTRRAFGVLAASATAFTLGHSATLLASARGWLTISTRAGEAWIALTLLFAALDLGAARARSHPPTRAGELVAIAAFGFVHGLGFATALGATDAPAGARLLAACAFNLGVEVGQIAIASALFGLIAVAARAPRPLAWSRYLSAYAIGVTGAYLLFCRTLPFLPS